VTLEQLADINTVPEVAECFRVSAKTLYREIAAKRLGCIRVGAGYRVTKAQAQEYARRNTREAVIEIPDQGGAPRPRPGRSVRPA
jgi:excisionase family DNA binding protein